MSEKRIFALRKKKKLIPKEHNTVRKEKMLYKLIEPEISLCVLLDHFDNRLSLWHI